MVEDAAEVNGNERLSWKQARWRLMPLGTAAKGEQPDERKDDGCPNLPDLEESFSHSSHSRKDLLFRLFKFGSEALLDPKVALMLWTQE